MANLLCPFLPTFCPNLNHISEHSSMPLVLQKKWGLCGKSSQIVALSRPRSDSMTVYAAPHMQKQRTGYGFGGGSGSGSGSPCVETQRKFSYVFRAENSGLVKVVVAAVQGMKYNVSVEASSCSEGKLFLSYGMFRSNSSQFLTPSGASAGIGSKRIPFVRVSPASHKIDLEFGADESPFYLSFLLHSSMDAIDNNAGIRTHKMSRFCVPVGLGPGCPMPLGISNLDDEMVNFSLFSKNAKSVVLCLYDGDSSNPSLEIDLDPYVNRTGAIWHVALENVKNYVSYGYRCQGVFPSDERDEQHVILDPYAKLLAHSPLAKCLGSLQKEPFFDWEQDAYPCLPLEKLVVYRLNVERFSKHESSELPDNVAGTFAGVAEKVEHLKALGINAILLEPIFPFAARKGPYFPYHFFSPDSSFGQANLPASAINSFKGMIKTLHSHGIEVLLEVMFTHTCENGDSVPQMMSFRGIDGASYYIGNGNVGSGDVNVLKCYNPIVQQLVIDSLRHWVMEFHIDGFCFTNSLVLAQGPDGELLSRSPLVEAIAYDPVLSKAKIVADSFSPLDMSNTETEFPHWNRWCEMNTRFCRDIRNFFRGEELLSNFATRLCGSGDIFSSRGPAFSLNYITRNFGLSLVDLVSFSSSNLASEFSWNCGEEGPSNNDVVLETRLKQIRNFLFILFVSLGIPVLSMGDESGYTTGGSPSYEDRQSIDWSALKTSFSRQMTQFIAFLSSLRIRRGDVFQSKSFLKVENITWYGSNGTQPKWDDPTSKFLAVAFKSENDDKMLSGDLFICFNANNCKETAILPEQPEGIVWCRLVDTGLAFPSGFTRVLTLNRPQQLNALSFPMNMKLLKLLLAYEADPEVKLLIMKGKGRAFCAGGDVSAVTRLVTEGDWTLGAEFFRNEFILNYIIATYSKPQVSICHGIVMGGGAGLSIHGKFRVATEKSVFAMPETSLGLFPDIGSSYFLSRLPGYFGEYVGLTGVRLDGAEMLACGLATHFVPSTKLASLEGSLTKVETSDPFAVCAIIDQYSELVRPKESSAYNRLDVIDKCFCKKTVEEIISALELEAVDVANDWIKAAIQSLRKASPISLKITLRAIREGRLQTIGQCLIKDYRLVCHILRKEISEDFFEGCRAILVDRDRNPKWKPSRLDLVDDKMIDQYFAKVEDAKWEELKFPEGRPCQAARYISKL